MVHRGSRLLEFVGEKAGKKAMDWLISKKVEVILGQSVKLNSVSDGAYETSGGETITADCHFLCTGTPLGSSWLKETVLRDSLDIHGRLMVDTKLRVKGHNNIFAIGDITDIPVSPLFSIAYLYLVRSISICPLLKHYCYNLKINYTRDIYRHQGRTLVG